MRTKTLLFASLSILLAFSACKGKTGAVGEADCNSCQDAMVRFYGDPALDGCGWVIDVASTIYMPKNLAPEFQEDSLRVKIKFKELERVNCGLIKDAHPSMQIEKMVRQ